EGAPRLDDPASDLVAARDAPEDVDQDGLDVRVVEDDPKRRGHLVRLGPATDVQEVGRLAACELDEVHGGHGQPGAVDHAADASVELDEVDARQPGGRLRRLLLVEVAHELDVGVPGQPRVIEPDL